MRPRFSIALLSEDSSEHTRMGLQAILEKLLRRFEDDGFTRRVEIVPVDAKLRPILIANRWRSTRPTGNSANVDEDHPNHLDLAMIFRQID